jgi:hypothetical protein
MKRPVLISTPIPSADEVAKSLGIGKSRLRRLRQIVDGYHSSSRVKDMASGLDGRQRDTNGRISERHGDRKLGAA